MPWPPLAPWLRGGFPPGLLGRNDIHTLIEHIPIEVYDPRTHIQSCWLDITSWPAFDHTLASPVLHG